MKCDDSLAVDSGSLDLISRPSVTKLNSKTSLEFCNERHNVPTWDHAFLGPALRLEPVHVPTSNRQDRLCNTISDPPFLPYCLTVNCEISIDIRRSIRILQVQSNDFNTPNKAVRATGLKITRVVIMNRLTELLCQRLGCQNREHLLYPNPITCSSYSLGSSWPQRPQHHTFSRSSR